DHLDGVEAFAGEKELHIRHVFHARCDMSVSLAVNRDRKFVENMENDRNVVRRQIPGDIDVLWEYSQVKKPAINIAELTEVSGLNNLRDLLHRRRIEKGVIQHQNEPVALGDLD